MTKTKIHLVSNAHIDPVWLWEWEDGAGAALSTFRQAAAFCEERRGYVFCHNESVLYQWVKDYDPALFARIRRLVRAGRWHVMGGWYVQPDCNMPSGESFVRQVLLGRRFFEREFGVAPRTAVNLDPFGHTRGLVQILAKSGHPYYLCCRPGQKECPLPSDEFVWVGYDGSEVLTVRASAHYCSIGGQAGQRLEDWLAAHPGKSLVIHLWGIGNHGGGPSAKDLSDFAALASSRLDLEIVHSTPDAYFAELEASRASLPRRAADLNPWAVGCYTSMVRVKQGHRRLENELFSAEKMVTAAWLQGLLAPYPADEFREAAEDLAFTEFHDILPGSAVPEAEAAALRRIGHGLEILARLEAGAFFALAKGRKKAAPGETPIFVFNPHPFPVRTIVECEFGPLEPHYDKTGFWNPRVAAGKKEVPSQPEKESSNLSLEWRKRVVFEAELAPSQLNRFDCRLETVPEKPVPAVGVTNGTITVETPDLAVSVNAVTGLLDRYAVGGREFLAPGALAPLAIADNADPWGMKVRSFRKLAGTFGPASPGEAARISGLRGGAAPAVRVVEDGPVRTVVESILTYRRSAVVLRLKVPKRGAEVEVEARVFWAEKDTMLKLSLPSRLGAPQFMGQVAFGADDLPSNGDEAVAQKWLALISEKDGAALTVINDGTYGSDYRDGELRLSLLRSPAYSADTWEDALLVPEDRFITRQEQGERIFRFWINAGDAAERMQAVDREALARNEKPYVLPFCPGGAAGARPGNRGRDAGPSPTPKPGITLGDRAVQVAAFKKAEDGNDIIIRLFEPTGRPRRTTVRLPAFGASARVRLGPFEVKTLRFNPRRRTFVETDLLERRLKDA